MTLITIIYTLLIVPAFAMFAYYSMRWAYEDLEEVNNNDKLGVYSVAGLLAIGWPLVAALLILKLANDYIDGHHV